MDKLFTTANAKVNLTLDVTSRRTDGYHELATVMHEIPLANDITIQLGGGTYECTTNLGFIRSDSNVALTAARLFFDRSGIDAGGVKIHIHKRIPVGAGMGGGSADAAAVLRALNDYYSRPFTMNELQTLGASLGADVPFCLAGGAALCEGIGEVITPLPPLSGCGLVVTKPAVSLSTAEMFAWFDRNTSSLRRRERPDTPGMVAALQASDADGVARRMFNAMESAAAQKCPDITALHHELLRLGAAGACMTGSGSAVCAIFHDTRDAARVADALRTHFSAVWALEL